MRKKSNTFNNTIISVDNLYIRLYNVRNKRKNQKGIKNMRYLRFGEVPENEKSINFIKLSFEQNEDYTYYKELGDMEKALACVPDEAYEAGVSVFEMGDDKMPIVANMKLAKSLLARLDCPIYEVTADEIARGEDGEPLVENITIEKKRRIKKDELIKVVLKSLLRNFKNAEYNEEDSATNTIHESCLPKKINIFTGEKVNAFEKTNDDWVLMPEKTEYKFNGWTLSDPVDGFCD